MLSQAPIQPSYAPGRALPALPGAMPDWIMISAAGAAVISIVRAVGLPLIARWRRGRRKAGHGQPLKRVVAMCEARWFLEELKLAMSGEQESMVKVGHMLMSGYGVRQDKGEAARWLRQAWALQNFKEPAIEAMLDVKHSTIPTLNAKGEGGGKPKSSSKKRGPARKRNIKVRLRKQPAAAGGMTSAAAGATAGTVGGSDGPFPKLNIDDVYRRVNFEGFPPPTNVGEQEQQQQQQMQPSQGVPARSAPLRRGLGRRRGDQHGEGADALS